MQASLIQSADEHHWVLLDHQLTQLALDVRSLRLQTWSLDASIDLRLVAPFALRTAAGAERTLDPAETLTLAPVLALLRRRVASVTVAKGGELTLQFGDGTALVARPSPRLDAWELVGGGTLEGMAYRCPPGGAMW